MKTLFGCKANLVNHFNRKFPRVILSIFSNFEKKLIGYLQMIFLLQTLGILGDSFCCTMMWWVSRIDQLMGLPPGLRLPPGDCLLRMLDLVPPRIKVFFYDKVTFCSCLIQRCWTRVPLHSSLSPQGVNLGRQFVKLT